MGLNKNGFSLVEVVLAIGILAIATLGVIAALTRVMVAQSSSSHHTVARIIADSVIREAVLAGPNDWGREPGVPIQTREATVGQNAELVTFYVEVTEQPIPEDSDGGGPLFNPAGPDMGDLWQVNVRVWWDTDDTGPSGAIERGKRSVEVTRLVYVEE